MIHPAPARRRHAAAATPPPRRRRHAAIATPPKPRCRSHTRHCHRAANATHAAATPWPTDVPRRRRHTARARDEYNEYNEYNEYKQCRINTLL